MAIIINQQQQIDNSVYQYEQRIKSPFAKYLDQTPVFVTYYHVDNGLSTVDTGYRDVKSIVGDQSPIGFRKIENLPLYGIDPVQVQLEIDDQGIDGNHTGDCVVMGKTVKPLANDFFIIPTIKEPLIFRVTAIQYDSAISNSYYRIEYMLEYIDEEISDQLDSQVIKEYTCVFDNIGTDEGCLIEKGALTVLNKVKEMYADIASTYFSIYYNERHNVFLGEFAPHMYLYDIYQTLFINKHKLFNERNNLEALILTPQYTDQRLRIKYEKSVYKFIERKNKDLIKNFYFIKYPGVTQKESSFARWSDPTIWIADICENDKAVDKTAIFSDSYIASVKINGVQKNDWAKLIQSYIRGEEIKITDIPLTLNDELLQLNGDIELFYMGPIILYILKEVMSNTIKNNSVESTNLDE